MYRKYVPFLLFLFFCMVATVTNKRRKRTFPFRGFTATESGRRDHGGDFIQFYLLFQYKMQPMGYEYDLINDFAKSQGLKLNIKVAENPARLIEMLEAGEADVVAYPIPINNKLKQEVIIAAGRISPVKY